MRFGELKLAVTRRLWRILHNAVAHPLMEILPERWGTWLHDETGKRAYDNEAN